jgi:hypothetical protein
MQDRRLGAALARLLAGEGVTGSMIHQSLVGNGAWEVTVSRLPQLADGLGFEPVLAVTLRSVAVKRIASPGMSAHDEILALAELP